MRAEYLFTALVLLPALFFIGLVPVLKVLLNSLPLEQTFDFHDCVRYASPLLIVGVAVNIVRAIHEK